MSTLPLNPTTYGLSRSFHACITHGMKGLASDRVMEMALLCEGPSQDHLLRAAVEVENGERTDLGFQDDPVLRLFQKIYDDILMKYGCIYPDGSLGSILFAKSLLRDGYASVATSHGPMTVRNDEMNGWLAIRHDPTGAPSVERINKSLKALYTEIMDFPM